MTKITQETTKDRAAKVVGEYLAAIAELPVGFVELNDEEREFFESADLEWSTCRENLNRCLGHGHDEANRDVVTDLQRGKIDFETAYTRLAVTDERTNRLKLGLELRLQEQAHDVVKMVFAIAIRERVRFQAAEGRIQEFKTRLEEFGLVLDGGVLAPIRAQIRALDTFIRENATGSFIEHAINVITRDDGSECDFLDVPASVDQEPALLRFSGGLRQAPSSILKHLQV